MLEVARNATLDVEEVLMGSKSLARWTTGGQDASLEHRMMTMKLDRGEASAQTRTEGLLSTEDRNRQRHRDTWRHTEGQTQQGSEKGRGRALAFEARLAREDGIELAAPDSRIDDPLIFKFHPQRVMTDDWPRAFGRRQP